MIRTQATQPNCEGGGIHRVRLLPIPNTSGSTAVPIGGPRMTDLSVLDTEASTAIVSPDDGRPSAQRYVGEGSAVDVPILGAVAVSLTSVTRRTAARRPGAFTLLLAMWSPCPRYG